MCGIVGIVNYNNKTSIDSRKIKKMLNGLKHRGPDGMANDIKNKVAIGMTRLAIIDLAGGMQPLFNEDKSIEIVGNGEIYNFKELQKLLINRGHKLRTKSDIEIVVHLYEEYGLNFVKRLRGMFALTIYDKQNGKVVLVRDRMGEKPIYYVDLDGAIIFSSELKSLLKYNTSHGGVNYSSLNKYFHFNYIPEPDTVFKNVKKLPPANMLIIDLKSKTYYKECYWKASDIKANDLTDPTDKIKKLLGEACNLCLRADVEIGISLSGGIDSAAVLAMSAPHYKDQMVAITVGYEGTPRMDERSKARIVAQKFKVRHIEREIKTKDFVEYFPNLVYDADDPIADIASFSIYSVSKIAKENKIKVLLNGIGGDELFWGYDWVRKVTNDNFNNRSFKEFKFYEKLNSYRATETFTKRLFSKEFNEEIVNDNILTTSQPKTKIDIARNSQNLIRDIWLTSNCIDLNDRLSMANSVELRSPLLDYKLVELAYSSKKNVLAFNRSSKFWLKKALETVLPQSYLDMPKQGFMPPVAVWFFSLIRRYGHLLKDGFLINEGIFSKEKFKIGITLMTVNPRLWDTYYQLLVMEIWGREYIWGQKPNEIKYVKK